MNPWQWLADTYRISADEWERVLTRTWFIVTPPTLTITALVLLATLFWRGRWRRRMPRAVFGLISGYALIMDREVWEFLTHNETIPQPWAMLFFGYVCLTAVYFAYALAREWVIPAMFWFVFTFLAWVRRDGYAPQAPEGPDDAESI